VPSYKAEELERIAESFLGTHAAGKYDHRALRIEAVVESYGYTIFQVPGLSQIAEAYIPIKPKYIFVDQDQYDSGSFRWRFTLAEELAHILIHLPMFSGKTVPEILQIQERITDAQYAMIERNAKFLAGCLLMTRRVFKERFQYFSEITYGQVSSSLTTNRRVIRQLSMDFNVSCYAAAIRAQHLKLLDQVDVEELIESFGW
jgi:Zn-dependent peptidase ImmA (M78 family)